MKIRNLSPPDFEKIVELNNANQPGVSELTIETITELHKMATFSWLIEHPETFELIGFCYILAPGQPYKSDNYRWISERYQDFLYLDRVVIAEAYQGKGYGRKLYEYWYQQSEIRPLILEVNVRPRNEGSILFHEKLGFEAVGEQDTEGGKKRVQYMLRQVRGT